MLYYSMLSSSLIREARLRAGLTQQELAGRLGTSQSVVSRWESGRVLPSAETLASIIGACGLELRVSLVAEDPGDASLIERSLGLTPEERFDELVQAVSFIQSGRAALRKRRG